MDGDAAHPRARKAKPTIAFALHVIEKMVVGLVAGETLAAGVPAIGGGVIGLVCVALILLISLLPYFAFRSVSRELGPGRMREMLLGPPTHVRNAAGSTM